MRAGKIDLPPAPAPPAPFLALLRRAVARGAQALEGAMPEQISILAMGPHMVSHGGWRHPACLHAETAERFHRQLHRAPVFPALRCIPATGNLGPLPHRVIGYTALHWATQAHRTFHHLTQHHEEGRRTRGCSGRTSLRRGSPGTPADTAAPRLSARWHILLRKRTCFIFSAIHSAFDMCTTCKTAIPAQQVRRNVASERWNFTRCPPLIIKSGPRPPPPAQQSRPPPPP